MRYARGVVGQRLTGGQALVRALLGEGVEVVFGLPGVQLDQLFDALYDVRDRLRVYHTRHEQASAYMADGYARTTGRVGVCMVVPGPGLLNAGAALATAYACSSPVLCVTGQVDSHAIDQGFGLLHEIPHQAAVLSALTKWSGRALAPADIPDLVGQAFTQLRAGRPRPVALELPVDVLQRLEDVHLRQHSPPEPAEETPLDPAQLRRAADLLHAAERPVIYSGGGTLAAGAWAELQAVAEILEAPVVMSVDGRGALSDRHDLAHTGVTGQALVSEADAVLGVGTRFWQPARVWGFAQGAKVIRVDADRAEIDRFGQPDVGIVGDARSVLAGLRDLLHGHQPPASRRAELRARKAAAAKQLNAFQPQAAFAHAIRTALPDDGITVNDLTQVTFFATVGFPVFAPRTFIGPGYQGTLGSAFATALGAQVGQPRRSVLAIAGDGGFMYSVAELATQRQHGLNVVSVVFNDGAFGNVKRTQEQTFGGRVIAADLVNPDFVALARSFGIDAERVTTPPQLEAAIRSALAGRAPALIEVGVGPMSNVWPVIGPAGGVYPVRLGIGRGNGEPT
ncbi:MAG: thiamine pyrophosphate-binding protein [Chloroflexi bacterium]|nr:thiamine pyrophosphate-binding protein [Chloroflexota bacterium]